MQPDNVAIPLGGLIALSVGTGVGAVVLICWMICAMCRSAAAAEVTQKQTAAEQTRKAQDAELQQQLQFEVEAVAPNLDSEYRKLYPMRPTLSEFAKAFLDNPGYAAWHDRVQAEVNRQVALHPGAALFVKVSRMP